MQPPKTRRVRMRRLNVEEEGDEPRLMKFNAKQADDDNIEKVETVEIQELNEEMRKQKEEEKGTMLQSLVLDGEMMENNENVKEGRVKRQPNLNLNIGVMIEEDDDEKNDEKAYKVEVRRLLKLIGRIVNGNEGINKAGAVSPPKLNANTDEMMVDTQPKLEMKDVDEKEVCHREQYLMLKAEVKDGENEGDEAEGSVL